MQIKTKKLPKNNSFDEKTSPIKKAIAACLGANDEEYKDSPMKMTRTRGMTDGLDEESIKNLNTNAHTMISNDVSALKTRLQSIQSTKEDKDEELLMKMIDQRQIHRRNNQLLKDLCLIKTQSESSTAADSMTPVATAVGAS